MKKITLFIALILSLSAFSTRYLVEGVTGTNSWRFAGPGEVNMRINDFRTWYYGNTFASDGSDEIWLAAGTYTITNYFGTKKVNIYGSFSGSETSIADRSRVSGGKPWEFSTPTIFDGNNTCPQGFNSGPSNSSTPFVIDGITITKCQALNGTISVYGVGAYVTQGCTVQNCVISNNKYNNTANTNSYDGKGGGIYLDGGKVLDSYIAGNKVVKGNGRDAIGGGIVFAWSNDNALNTVSGCTIENNSTTGGGGGMAVIIGTGGTINDCIFKNNSADGRGGGLWVTTDQAGIKDFNIKNCQFIENTSGDFGGGVALSTSTLATTTFEGCSLIGNIGLYAGGMYIGYKGKFSPIKNCIFRDNKCTNSTNAGHSAGALYCNYPDVILQNCIFANNSTLANSGTNSTVKMLNLANKIYNCTFVNNSDPGSAGYTLNLGGQATPVINNIFWGNEANANFYAASASISTYNATTSDKNTTGSVDGSSEGNITTLTLEPNNAFVLPTTFVGAPTDATSKTVSATADWRLIDASPAVDTGKDLTSEGVVTSIDGEGRPLGNAFDMGAYETSAPTGHPQINVNKNFCSSLRQEIIVNGLSLEDYVNVYGISGNLIYSQNATKSTMSVKVPQGIYIVRVADKVNKVAVK